jgi:mannose-6-phosphate isomerase-like protein (cupin superfamily)
MTDAFDLNTTYLNIKDDRATEIDGTTFWQLPEDEINRLADGWLVAAFLVEDDTHWEMHPAGDEVLTVVSGALTLIQETKDGERRIEMPAGASAINPAGTWHRFTVGEPARLLAMTYGEGTQHRPL